MRIEDRFDTNIDDLWSALAVPERLARWLGRFEGDLRLGGGFRARSLRQRMGRHWPCRSVRPTAPSACADDRNQAPSNQDVIEITLSAAGEQDRTTSIEQRGLPRDQLAAYAAGLQIHVEDLAAYLVGGERCDGPARWKELFPQLSGQADRRKVRCPLRGSNCDRQRSNRSRVQTRRSLNGYKQTSRSVCFMCLPPGVEW